MHVCVRNLIFHGNRMQQGVSSTGTVRGTVMGQQLGTSYCVAYSLSIPNRNMRYCNKGA